MKCVDYSLYLVLDPDLCGGLDGMVHTARQAVAGGVTIIQLRASAWKKRRWLDAALALKALLAPLGVPLIINDHVDVAMLADADGVHLGQADLPVAKARCLLGADKIVGLSVSNAAQLTDVDGADYLGVGPVYPTRTKKDAAPVLGVEAFSRIAAASSLPVVAIGGIDADNCAPLIAAGAHGVAVVSAICGHDDPRAAARGFRRQRTED
ncbi:MAG: thiamine phosphate synthase [Candidatus Accumulibacter sp.]|jgi:thiamine-phosphate pyrophosphorylase|nr:thiamine phosphate synthase [Accumulibacter sp.]